MGGWVAGQQVGRLGWQAEKQADRKNFGVLLEGVRFTFYTITFAYVRPAFRLSRRDIQKVQPPSKV